MPYPSFVLVTVSQISGTSCGPKSHRFEYESQSNPPIYYPVEGGEFTDGTLSRVSLGGGAYTWELEVTMSGTCGGNHIFRRTTAADDPTGNFCKVSGGSINCTAGQATSADDD